ncbi:MAG: hypothetical protein ACK486_18250 [Cyanobacteriota bacterium]
MTVLRPLRPSLRWTLGFAAVALAIGVLYGWERNLNARLEQAAAAGRLEECLRYGNQLAALSWLPGHSRLDPDRCRRQRALQLWQAKQWREALTLQQQLVEAHPQDAEARRRRTAWGQELRNRASRLFQAGDLEGALAAAAPLPAKGEASLLKQEMLEIWNRNRLQLERADRLVGQARWWEALDALNRIDHPWWQQRGVPLKQKAQAGIQSLKGKEKEHDNHGEGELAHSVPVDQLDALVQRRIAAGVNDWQAFQQACAELGGRVVEAGPESACQKP